MATMHPIVIYYYNLNLYFQYILKCNLFLYGKAEFSAAITPLFSVTWSFRNNSNMLILCSRNIYFYYYYINVENTLLLLLLLIIIIILSLLSLLIHLIHPCWIKLLIKNIYIFTDPKIVIEINTVPRKQAFIKGFVIYPGIRHDTSIEIQIVQSVVPVEGKKDGFKQVYI